MIFWLLLNKVTFETLTMLLKSHASHIFVPHSDLSTEKKVESVYVEPEKIAPIGTLIFDLV